MTDNRPFALFITWTCYGTWLPGDPRGYVSGTLSPTGRSAKQNTPDTPYCRNSPSTLHAARLRQKWETVTLTEDDAQCVATALMVAAQARGWRILRAAIMANHVHVLVVDCPDDGSAVRRVLKGTAQAALSKLHGQTRRWWTARGSDRYLRGEDSIARADQYVAAQNRPLAFVGDMQVVSAQELG